jgi:hypothetical protein
MLKNLLDPVSTGDLYAAEACCVICQDYHPLTELRTVKDGSGDWLVCLECLAELEAQRAADGGHG